MSKLNMRVDNITKSFGDKDNQITVLRGVEALFKQGNTYAITGVSGTGKSTLLHLLAGLDKLSSGEIFYGTTSLSSLKGKKQAAFLQKTIGLVFQSPYLISELSVEENVMLPALIAGQWRFRARKKARELLNLLGIEDKAADHPASLSGGQQQRVALARALINKPAFLLADEPTGNLDIKTGKQLVDLICTCQREWGMGVVVTSHDLYVAKSMQQVLELRDGRLHARFS